MAPVPDAGPAGGMCDSRIRRPLDALLKDHEALLTAYCTNDRKAFRKRIVSVLENTFGLLATLYGCDPWRHFLTEHNPDLVDCIGLDEILRAIWHLRWHDHEWETPK